MSGKHPTIGKPNLAKLIATNIDANFRYRYPAIRRRQLSAQLSESGRPLFGLRLFLAFSLKEFILTRTPK